MFSWFVSEADSNCVLADGNLVVIQDGEVHHRAANLNVDKKDSLQVGKTSPPSPELVVNKSLPAKFS